MINVMLPYLLIHFLVSQQKFCKNGKNLEIRGLDGRFCFFLLFSLFYWIQAFRLIDKRFVISLMQSERDRSKMQKSGNKK